VFHEPAETFDCDFDEVGVSGPPSPFFEFLQHGREDSFFRLWLQVVDLGERTRLSRRSASLDAYPLGDVF